MTKSEFIAEVARRGRKEGLTKNLTSTAFDYMVEVFEELMQKEESFVLTGVCTIGVKTVAPKNIINPSTRQPMTTKESKTLFIKTGAVLKRELNK